MLRKAIVLPNGKRVTLTVYTAAFRAIKEIAPERLVANFSDYPIPAADVLHAMRAGIHDRINRQNPDYGKGRKWSEGWQIGIERDAIRLRDIAKRIRIYQFETTECRSRFAYKLARFDD
jgi:hypothetical protein